MVAIDISESVVVRTRQAAAVRDLANVTCAVGDVYDLAYPERSFDVVHAHQVLQHVADPVGALVAMRRACKPGGIIAARDSDYAAFTWYPEIPALREWLALYHQVARANGGEPDAGRRLLSWPGFGCRTPRWRRQTVYAIANHHDQWCVIIGAIFDADDHTLS